MIKSSADEVISHRLERDWLKKETLWKILLWLLLLSCLCPQEYKARRLKTKQEAKNKISTVARGPNLRQDKMTQEWAPSCSAVSRLTAAGIGKRSHVDLGMRHSSDDRPRSESQDPTHSAGRDSQRQSIIIIIITIQSHRNDK